VLAGFEQVVLEHALSHPWHGATRVEQELGLKGILVSSGEGAWVWQRNGLLIQHERLLRLEKVIGSERSNLTRSRQLPVAKPS
jgi:hypothetical protein